MSDKSFGDYTNKSIVKNPLLSSAVTGLSLEDLTHKAVLLPVTPSLGQISRSDQQQGSQEHTLAHLQHETPTSPSGDALSNITPSSISKITSQTNLDSDTNLNLEKIREPLSVTQSEASVKSSDDFDVNEYIARLQGSRYVSAPLHSHLKEDQNADLEATEENLEEINLNESQSPVEVQQSLTADIAQNFSQLPNVLPHVASAVFSSFSNMLNYKSREQTPDHANVRESDQRGNKGGYDEVQFQRPDVGIPMMGKEEYGVAKEVAPPPKEPIGGTGNFRITTKKKYAQIPGLSSGETVQTMTHNAPGQNIPVIQNIPPFGQNMPPFPQHVPLDQDLPAVSQGIPPIGQSIPPIGQSIPPIGQSIPPIGQSIPPVGQSIPPFGQNRPPFGRNIPQVNQSVTPFGQSMPPVGQSVPKFFNPNDGKVEATEAVISHESNINTQNVAVSQYNVFNPATENQNIISAIDMPASDSQPNILAETNSPNLFASIEHKEQAPPKNIPNNPVSGSASIIPPPPMFSNVPRRGNQSSIEKSILPPSVARRISANQPIVKPTFSSPSFSENIFVPAPVSENANESSSETDNSFPTGLSQSTLVPGQNSPFKMDQTGPPPSIVPHPSQMNVPCNIPPTAISQTPGAYFMPPKEGDPKTSTEASVFFSPKETAPTAVVSTSKVVPSSNVSSINVPPASSIFTSGGVDDMNTQSVVPLPMFQPPPQNLPPSLTLVNPLLQKIESSFKDASHPITQMPPMANPEPPKPVIEPPKATGNVNFRMTKKRPQYYAGPIEGVGAISNNVKPIITPVIPSATPAEVGNFRSALFTPEQPIQPFAGQHTAPYIEQASMPFDISRPVENMSSHLPFDGSKSQEQAYISPYNMNQPDNKSYGQEYNTAFDMSRPSADAYSPPKQESRGFGIIGSLKSKLSSIDINKIQSTVTTFFDPAYNEAKALEPIGQDNSSFGHQHQPPRGQSNFEIFVPNVEQSQYSQFKEVGFDYSHNNQYYQTQDHNAQNQGQNVYSTSSYFTNPNYSTEQVYSGNPLYDNSQSHLTTALSTQRTIPDEVETIAGTSKSKGIATFYKPNTLTQENTIRWVEQQQQFVDISSQNKDHVKSDTSSTITTQKNQHNENYFSHDLNPNFDIQQQGKTSSNHSQHSMEQQKNRQTPVNLQESSCSLTTVDKPAENTASVSASEKSQGPMFYNPTTFTIGNQQIAYTDNALDDFGCGILQTYQINEDFSPNIHKIISDAQKNSRPPCDSALNTSKYNMSSIQKSPRVPLLPAATFFDNPEAANLLQFNKDKETETKVLSCASTKSDIQPEDLQQEQFESKNLEIYKMLSETPIPAIVSKSKSDTIEINEDNKHKEVERERLLKENNLIESLSKDDIPILGVSTVPLFGLSAMIANKSREVSDSGNEMNDATFFDKTYQSRNPLDKNSGVSFFENMKQDNKFISESQVKHTPLDITALSITDVKNVLVIEPPQENIVTLLKRNASSSKLESLQKMEVASPEHVKQQNDKVLNAACKEKLITKVDENTCVAFFKHSDIEVEGNVVRKDASMKNQQVDDALELSICESCREVNTPDLYDLRHKETEDLTAQIIENITSQIQLSNPLTVPLTESDPPVDESSQLDNQQFEEIMNVAEATIETLQVQSATELLDDHITTSEPRNYGWASEDAAYLATAHINNDYGNKIDSDTVTTRHVYGLHMDATSAPIPAQDYQLKVDPNAIGFFGDNSLFFDNLPTNASDEIKAEIKHSHEDIVLPRQMSIPSAPPEENDSKLDEPGVLDVHSIEQDAKKDFPLQEEHVIDPSSDDFLSTDDDKIEFRERERSSEDSTSNDTFTNRIERFKKTIDNPNDDAFELKRPQIFGSPPMSMASYFDTGNYAVESHYRNSLNTPISISASQFSGNVMRIPPGFEEEYARRLSEKAMLSLTSGDNKNEPCIPETSTQTRPIAITTYSSPQHTNENVVGFEMRRKENIKAFADAFTKSYTETNKPTPISETIQSVDNAVISNDPIQTVSVLSGPTFAEPELFAQNIQPLQDPMKFFSSNVVDTKPEPETPAPENFNRLASYFSMPPPQPEHSKSFFELSQSQNHYRHESITQNNKNMPKPFFELSQSQNHYIDDDTKNNIQDLMKDLTSPQNIQKNISKTVYYFTEVKHDNDVKSHTNAAPIKVNIFDKTNVDTKLSIENKLDSKLVEDDCNDPDDIMTCKYCLSYILGINAKDFKFRTVTNETSGASKEGKMTSAQKNSGKSAASVSFSNFDVEGQAQGGVAVLNESRDVSEYTPVKHHWFYRVEVEEKSVWRGFSIVDSQALEDAFQSPDLDENTLVATDGGRYDVNVMGRLRIAVYWKEKPTNVRRCSWFYKGTTDARYVPYTEVVAEKLEEEYRHGITTGEWHRKLTLPNNEMVIMHGPSVMVHFLQSSATEAFSTPPNLLGKHVYRNPPKIRVARDQEPTIDHLIFLVHGVGEYKREQYIVDQTTSRPRVVRRSHEESEIEDPEPSKIDHLLLLCHGVGSACDMRFRSVEEVVEDFRATSLQLLQSHYRNSYDNGIVSRVEVLPISWHDQLHSGEAGVDLRLARVTLDSIPRLRAFTNHTVLDVLFYTSPVFHQTIISTVCSEMNRAYNLFKQRNPQFKGGVSVGGHSLGSVILYDLLCHQLPKSPVSGKKIPPKKTYVTGTAVTGQPAEKYPQLVFLPDALYALGSPIAIFECIRGVESLGLDFALPTCKNFFNIFHPYDPIAYRIEPLVNPQLQGVKPCQIPHHKGRKRMHLELRDTMARVGADLKQKLVESLRTTWNMWKATPPPTDRQLEKVVEEEMEEKVQLYEDEQPGDTQATPEMLGLLNNGRRIDYVLQEAPLEMINEYLFAMSSHVGYWESEDTMLLILREIYSSLGVEPDSTVPQPTMTVQRTRTIDSQDESACEPDVPSTSRGNMY